MRKDKYKKTAATAHLQCPLRVSVYGCGQECRFDFRARGGGFTLSELLLVVLIIAIAAMIAVPMMSSMDSMQIRTAANMIAADIVLDRNGRLVTVNNSSALDHETNDTARREVAGYLRQIRSRLN